MVSEAVAREGRQVPRIFPGMRVGRLHVELSFEREAPALLPCSPYKLYEERVVSHFRDSALTGFEAYPVDINTPDLQEGTPKYHEFVTFPEAGLTDEAGLREERCTSCGYVQRTTYDALLVDSSEWDGSDFVRTPALISEVVSDRVKAALEGARFEGIAFVPGSRLGAGPGKKSLTEVLADLEFERQRALRRL
jgi:hypothetical protein